MEKCQKCKNKDKMIEKLKQNVKELMEYTNSYECKKCGHMNPEGFICMNCGYNKLEEERAEAYSPKAYNLHAI